MTPQEIIQTYPQIFNKTSFDSVKHRVARFAADVRPEIEEGRGLKDLYQVNSLPQLIDILIRFENGQTLPDRFGELENDYLFFLRSENIVPGTSF
jgi:hypothetical protein